MSFIKRWLDSHLLSKASQKTVVNKKNSRLLSDTELQKAMKRYDKYHIPELGYATVKDYCDSMDNLHDLACINNDLKDVQRPWIFKAIIGNVNPGGKLIEIGAGEPHVAGLLRRMGYEVWVVDPYDGCGNGPTEYDSFKSKYPDIKFIKQYFHEDTSGLEPGFFDCVYSVSVIEHMPFESIAHVCKGIRKFLKSSGGYTIHAIDHVLKGEGAVEHLNKLNMVINELEISGTLLQDTIANLENDTETYFLSAYGHNLWRGTTCYDKFPMRKCVSIQICKMLPG